MKTKLTAITVVLVLLAAVSVRAQGTAFTYQGGLNDSNGPANGVYDFHFRLFKDSLGSTQAGPTILANALSVSNGLFTATLDFGAGIFTGSNFWLQVGVRTNGATNYNDLTPLQALTAAPYAVMANSASNLLGAVPAVQLSGTLLNSSLPGSPAFSGTVSAGAFSGAGSGLTGLNANNLSAGTLPDARLAGNVARTNQVWLVNGNAGTTAGANYLGTGDSQPLEFHVNGQRALRLEPDNSGQTPALPNVIGGSSLNSAGTNTAAVIGGGSINRIYNGYGVIGGGYANTINGGYSVVAGGNYNAAGGDKSVVGGGNYNTASAAGATISGGDHNQAGSADATVGGGYLNIASGGNAWVGGGFQNTASGDTAAVGGGGNNTAGGSLSVVAGGDYNSASGAFSFVGGGQYNAAGGRYSFAAGYSSKADYDGDFVWADSQLPNFNSTGNDQFLVRAQGGVGINTASPQQNLSVNGGMNIDQGNNNNGTFTSAGLSFGSGSGEGISSTRSAGSTQYDLEFYTAFSYRMVILNNGNVGIGSIIPQYPLDVYGTIRGFNVSPSDARFKQNIAPLAGALDKVLKVRGVSFDWRRDEFPKRNFPSGRQLGFIAQEIKEVLPEVVSQDSEGFYSVDYGKLAPLLVEAIKEQQSRLDEQAGKKDAEIQQLRESLAELKQQVSRLTAIQNPTPAEHAERK
jgi:hypothetical protein